MRKGITIEVTPADRGRLQSIIRDRNSPQKHVWRARIVLLSADGLGTMAIMRAVGKGKTVVWRWQERFMREGGVQCTTKLGRPSARSEEAWVFQTAVLLSRLCES